MESTKNIALVAHDHRKKDLADWTRWNSDKLSRHALICTGTTGKMIEKVFDEEIDAWVEGWEAVDRAAAEYLAERIPGVPDSSIEDRGDWLDDLAEAVLLTCASDWPFMVSHGSSADYARSRLTGHVDDVANLLQARRPRADSTHRPFGDVDVRGLTPVAPAD